MYFICLSANITVKKYFSNHNVFYFTSKLTFFIQTRVFVAQHLELSDDSNFAEKDGFGFWLVVLVLQWVWLHNLLHLKQDRELF